MSESENVLSLPSCRSNLFNPADSYVKTLGSKRSQTTVENCVQNIAKILGHSSYDRVEWSKLRRSHWQKILGALEEKGCSPSTKNLYLTVFKGVAKEAWSNDLLPQSAYLKISSLKSLKFERLPKGRSLDLEEGRRLLESCFNGTTKGFRDRAIFAVMMGCGLRRAEVVSLKLANWNCIDRSFSFIGKGNKERRVYLPKNLDKYIDEWLIKRGLEAGTFFPGVSEILCLSQFHNVVCFPGKAVRLWNVVEQANCLPEGFAHPI
ncbi:tyrosine-type recombinase/integrase, partial [Turicimonas muris]